MVQQSPLQSRISYGNILYYKIEDFPERSLSTKQEVDDYNYYHRIGVLSRTTSLQHSETGGRFESWSLRCASHQV